MLLSCLPALVSDRHDAISDRTSLVNISIGQRKNIKTKKIKK